MEMLPPQVELEPIWLVFSLAILAIALLTCNRRTGEAGRSNAPLTALRSRAASPSGPLGRHQ